MNGKRYGRIAVLGAAAVLLAGCGGGGGDEPADKPLGKKQLDAVLPDAKAMSGWKVAARLPAEPLPEVSRTTLCGGHKSACDGLRSFAQSTYTDPGKEFSVLVSVFAAEDAAGAEPAYDRLWERVEESVGQSKGLEAGTLGDEHYALQTEYGRTGGPAAQIQVRVGATVLQITGEALRPGNALDLDAVVDVATVVTERAEQAGRGEAPSAVLGG
ncbi:hypothetical protein [Streptomyces sp. N35]|uniref:hypothetical protein n=1 Tax=Streptomyces sp. N35 TaxID=2795730 RepID=UPI0018F70638|nr:hypothetical protein [Streptomyces sp. N35]